MEIHSLHWVLIFFCLGALIGLYLISRVFRGLGRPNGVMMLHGLFAAVGIGVLFYHSAFEATKEVPYASIFFFILAVFGGVFMVMWDKIMNRKVPKLFPVLHGAAAATGLILLVLFMIRHHLF
jgi:FtsH-binding integral membrane protein